MELLTGKCSVTAGSHRKQGPVIELDNKAALVPVSGVCRNGSANLKCLDLYLEGSVLLGGGGSGLLKRMRKTVIRIR